MKQNNGAIWFECYKNKVQLLVAITFTAKTWQVKEMILGKKEIPRQMSQMKKREAAQDLSFIISFSAYFSLSLAVSFFLEQGF